MAELEFVDFDLLIERLGEGKYRARVLSSPAGQAIHEFTPPFSNLELENFYLRIGRPKQGVRRVDSPEMQAAKAVGARLFEAVFNDEIYASFRTSFNMATSQGKGLRIRLRLDSPELNDYPWEFLYNPSLNSFLSLAVDTPVVRYLDLPFHSPTLAVKPPLKILVMICSPKDYPPLNIQNEWDNLVRAIAPLEQRGLVVLERLTQPTLSALQKKLREAEYHIFHYIGHGVFDPATQEGMLLVEDNNGRSQPISGQYIGTILHNHRSFRLAILNACEGARSSQSDPFSGVAHSLVQRGIPSVIAMQFEITDKAAITFSEEFYAAVADGYTVDAALAEARCAIFSHGNDIEWGTPVYFSRLLDGRVFDEQTKFANAKTSRSEKPEPLQGAEQNVDAELQQKLEKLYTKSLSAYWLKDWEQAAHYFKLILEINPDDQDIAEKLIEVSQQLKHKQRYEQALAAFKNQEYREAAAAFEELVAEAPDYKDAALKLQFARKQVMLSDFYKQAKQLYQAQQWQAVINIFDRIAELAPDFSDPEELLPTARREFETHIAKQEAQRQKFTDPKGIAAKANKGAAREDQETQRQKDLDFRYIDAVRLMQAGQYRQALKKWGEIQAIEPGYPDQHQVQKTAREGLNAHSRQRTVIFILGFFLLLLYLGRMLGIIGGGGYAGNPPADPNAIQAVSTSLPDQVEMLATPTESPATGEQWFTAFTYEPPTGTWESGEHRYHYESFSPDGDGTTADVIFNVSPAEPLYEGYVLLRPWALQAWTGEGCEPVDAIHPDQPTRFHNGWIYVDASTYDEALASLESLKLIIIVDDDIYAELKPNGIISAQADESHFCIFTK